MKFTNCLLYSLTFLLALPAEPQQARSNIAASASTVVPPLIPYSGVVSTVPGAQPAATASITFLIYKDELGGEPLFAETQSVALDATGHYKAQLGETLANGIPIDLFASGEARWLEIQIAGQNPQPRVLIASVPYALKAADAATLGGLPASAYVLAGTKTASPGSQNVVPDTSSAVTTTGGTTGYLPVFNGAATVIDSTIFQDSTGIGIGTATPAATLDVNGTAIVTGALSADGGATFGAPVAILAKGKATPTAGFGSHNLAFEASTFNSGVNLSVPQTFELEVEPVGNDTAVASSTLEVLFGQGTAAPTPTGLSIGANGQITFAPGQIFPGTADGTITGVTAGTDLTGGGTAGAVTLNLNTASTDARYARLAAANSFTGNQTVDGSVTATSFSGSGAALTGVVATNSAALGGLVPAAYAELALNNTFSGIQSFNKIGIGTATPRSLLEGQAAASQALGPVFTLTNTLGGLGAESALDFNTLLPSTTGVYNPMARIVAEDANHYSDNLLFQSNTPGAQNNGLQTNMVITSAGLVGIGTTTPTSQLQVNGSVTATSFYGSGAGLTGVAQQGGNVTFGTVNAVNGFNLGGSLFAFGSLANYNAFLGFAGNTSSTGDYNTASGYEALISNTTGASNTASGYRALYSNTTGTQNTAFGIQSLFSNTTSSGNTATGVTALFYNTTGENNTANGHSALYNNTTGTQNTASGYVALIRNTTGNYNTASGWNSLAWNSTGEYNTAIGSYAGVTADSSEGTGSNDTAIGANALLGTGSLTNATAIGANAEVTESNTMVLGCIEGTNGCANSVNVGIGTTTPTSQLQVNGTVTATSFVGNGSGLTNITAAVTNASELGGLPASAFAQLAASNSFTGNQSITGNLSASGTASAGTVNASTGFYLGGTPFAFVAGSGSIYLGFSGNLSAEGSFNAAIGFNALEDDTTGTANTATGYGALAATTTADNNVASGFWALTADTTGSNNLAVGAYSLYTNTTGQNNVGVGDGAGQTLDRSSGTGSNNTILGGEAVFATGSISNATAIGAYAEVDQNNTLVLGCTPGVNTCPAAVSVGIGTTTPDNLLTVNGSADKPGGGSWGTYSDGRLKTVNGSFGSGLDQVMQLRPIRYRYKPDNALGIRDADEHIGVVAQEVQRIIPEAVSENAKGYLLVNNDPIIWSMVNAIKEQQKEIEEQRKLLRAQNAAMRSLAAEVRETRKTLRQVKAQAAAGQLTMVASK